MTPLQSSSTPLHSSGVGLPGVQVPGPRRRRPAPIEAGAVPQVSGRDVVDRTVAVVVDVVADLGVASRGCRSAERRRRTRPRSAGRRRAAGQGRDTVVDLAVAVVVDVVADSVAGRAGVQVCGRPEQLLTVRWHRRLRMSMCRGLVDLAIAVVVDVVADLDGPDGPPGSIVAVGVREVSVAVAVLAVIADPLPSASAWSGLAVAQLSQRSPTPSRSVSV